MRHWWNHVKARLGALRSRLAIPGWVAVSIVVVRQAFEWWSNIEFAWQKFQQLPPVHLAWAYSDPLLLVAGIAWLSFLVLRPVRAELKSQPTALPDLNLFDGEHVTLQVFNPGKAACTYQARAKILNASFDFRLRHPITLKWANEENHNVELPPLTAGRVLVAEYEWGDESYGYVYVRGSGGGIDSYGWSLDAKHKQVTITMQITVMCVDAPYEVFRDVTVELIGSLKRRMISARLAKPVQPETATTPTERV